MKKMLITCLTIVSASLFSQNFAYISQKKILESVSDYSKFTTEKDNMKKGFEEELQKEVKAISEKFENLLKPYDVKKNEDAEALKKRLKPMDLEKFNLLIEEDKFTQKKQESYEKQLNDFNTTKISPILTKINKTIEDYSVKNKIDVVYVIENIAPALGYINKGKEVTDKIIDALKK